MALSTEKLLNIIQHKEKSDFMYYDNVVIYIILPF